MFEDARTVEPDLVYGLVSGVVANSVTWTLVVFMNVENEDRPEMLNRQAALEVVEHWAISDSTSRGVPRTLYTDTPEDVVDEVPVACRRVDVEVVGRSNEVTMSSRVSIRSAFASSRAAATLAS